MATTELTGISAVPKAATIAAKRPGLHARRYTQLRFVITDILCVAAAGMIALWWRFRPGSGWSNHLFSTNAVIQQHLGFLVLFSGLVVLSCEMQQLYRGIQARRREDETMAVLRGITIATVLLMSFIYGLNVKTISRLVVVFTALGTAMLLVGWRRARRHRMISRKADGIECRNVLIVGDEQVGHDLLVHLSRNPQLGYVAKGLLSWTEAKSRPAAKDIPLLGCVDRLREIARLQFVDEIIITPPAVAEDVKKLTAAARRCGLDVRIVPELYDGLALHASLEYIGQFPTMAVYQQGIPAVALLLKRALDIIVSAAALILLAPLFLTIAIAVLLDSAGPVFYRSPRLGRKGALFNCYKFRTMVANADELREKIQHMNERDGILFKVTKDPRITSAGRFLRKYSLDEIPQFWNVLKGDMSLVGPRPPLADEVERYGLEHLRRLDVLPGITGLWQVEARRNPSFETYMTLDTHYVEQWDIWLDLKILLRTISVVVAGTGQ